MSPVSKTLPEIRIENLMIKIEESLAEIQTKAVGVDLPAHKTVKLILDIERIRRAQVKLLNDLNRALGSYHFE
jgi:hypothetical protein